jgi:hypothetical protein
MLIANLFVWVAIENYLFCIDPQVRTRRGDVLDSILIVATSATQWSAR